MNRGSTIVIGLSVLVGLVGVPTVRFGFMADLSASLFLIASLWIDCLVSYCGIRSGVLEERSEAVKWLMSKIGKFPGLFGPSAVMTPLCFFIPWPLAIIAGVWRFSGAMSWSLPHLSKSTSGLLNGIEGLFEKEKSKPNGVSDSSIPTSLPLTWIP